VVITYIQNKVQYITWEANSLVVLSFVVKICSVFLVAYMYLIKTITFSAIILKVSLGVRFLISETIVDNAYKGFVKGLMGNFDGNSTNDFILPNGTILDETKMQKEKDIYFDFGQQCKLLLGCRL
jgi:hypothetical protein